MALITPKLLILATIIDYDEVNQLIIHGFGHSEGGGDQRGFSKGLRKWKIRNQIGLPRIVPSVTTAAE